MNNSLRAIPKILEDEGGFVNNPNDPGGPTNKGITLATFRRYIKPTGTVADLAKLTTDQAVIVYKRQYWDAVSADLLPAGVDYTVADFAVNSGPSRASKVLQQAVGVAADGIIGPNTLAATRALSPEVVIDRVCDERLAFMKRIRNRKTNKLLWDTFGNGWSTRVRNVRATSQQWASEDPVVKAPAEKETQPNWVTSMFSKMFDGRR